MSEITRQGLKIISNILAESQDNIFKLLGDSNKNPGALINLEALLCKLRGSTFFYNEDYSAPRYPAPTDPTVIETFNFVKFSGDDNFDFGLQGAYFTKNYNAEAPDFPVILSGSNWNPSYYGPPCTEGFGTWHYNAWKGYEKDPPSTPNFEDGNYNLRYESLYPVRYNDSATPFPYTRVAYFEHARYISLFNNSSTASIGPNDFVYVFNIDADDLYGTQIVDAETDLPKDVRFMYYTKLVQKYNAPNWETIEISTIGNFELQYLSHKIEKNGNKFRIKINIPDDLVYDPVGVGGGGTDHFPKTYWHIIMFWGSKDPKALEDVVAFNNIPVEKVFNSNEYIIWNVKHFFNRKLDSKITWTDHAINDSKEYNYSASSQRYLVANDRMHFELVDGTTNVLPQSNPYKYILSDNILTELQNYSNNSISNLVSNLEIDQFQSAILMAKPYGAEATTVENKYKGRTLFALKLGPKFTSVEARSDWENFKYFPQPDDDYFTFAKLILKRAKPSNYGSIEANFVSNSIINSFDPLNSNQITILQKAQIIWFEQMPPSFAVRPHGDQLISSIIVPYLYNTLNNFRFEGKDKSLLNSAARILILASRTPSSIANSFNSLQDENGAASNIFRRLLKSPVDPLLQPDTDESLAIQFDAKGRRLIEGIASRAPSTEMLRLNADNLFIVKNKLNFETTFEIFHEPTDQCTAADNQSSGNRIGLDYTLRLYLVDQSENVLSKDWYIMASKYFLTREEFNNRVEKEQSIAGYFTYDNLESIDEWRLHGYSSIVPDLSMGLSRVLTTKVVSPPDGEQETEEQFRAKYEALGYTQEEIDELVLQFLEEGGQFYVVDLFKYDNKFTSIRDAAINITTLTEGIPYWQSNIRSFYQLNRPDPEPDEGPFYSDSFTIALEGVSGSDLEKVGKKADTFYSFTPSSNLVDLILHNNLTAFKFTTGLGGGQMTTAVLKLKTSLFNEELLTLSNNGTIVAELYSSDTAESSTGKPSVLLSKSTNSVLFSELEKNTYKEFEWLINFELQSFTQYWLALRLDAAPQDGNIVIATQSPETQTFRELEVQAFSFVNISDTNTFSCILPLSVVLSTNNTTNGFTNTTGTFDIKIYNSKSDGSIGSQVNFTSTNGAINFTSLKSFEINFTFDAQVNLSRGEKYWIVLAPSERPRGGSISVNFDSIFLNEILYTKLPNSLGTFKLWDNWNNLNYRAYLKITKNVAEIYGYFNRDSDNLTYFLPGPNTNRITSVLISKESSWAFTIKKFPKPSIVYLFPRYGQGLTRLTGTITAVLSNSSVSGSGTKFSEELKPGSIIYNNNGNTIGVVNTIINDTNLTLIAGSNTNYTGNFNTDGFLPFFNDMYVVIRLIVGGDPKDYFINLPKNTNLTEPIQINNEFELAESIAYLYVAKTAEELQNGYHGAPPGDRLVIRSS